jgi:hypothetical protein
MLQDLGIASVLMIATTFIHTEGMMLAIRLLKRHGWLLI